tara:strand:+ start:2499 stop:2747 length:249 start_codon:yes stop_codon:yes gene_type:complete
MTTVSQAKAILSEEYKRVTEFHERQLAHLTQRVERAQQEFINSTSSQEQDYWLQFLRRQINEIQRSIDDRDSDIAYIFGNDR